MGDARVTYSVIIPTYNREPLLVEALRSVHGARPDFCEVIVVNDGTAFEPSTQDLIETLGAVFVQTKGGSARARRATSAQSTRAGNGFYFWMTMILLPPGTGRRSPATSTRIFNLPISPMGFAAPASSQTAA